MFNKIAAASGNSVAIKSYQNLTINDGLLAKVVEATKSGEKDARTSGVVKSFEVFYVGHRQNISIGKIYIIPAKVCDSHKDFPIALLYGTVVREFNLGEETADLIETAYTSGEFDEYSQASYQSLKDRLFTGEDGKLTSLIVFAPSWSGIREYVAFKFVSDETKLANSLRHLVFSAYYSPNVSSAFDALMTTVDTSKLDVTDITPKLTYPFLSENPLRAYPEFSKQGGWTKEKIFLTAKTADAITKEVLNPQELNVFEALDSALTEAALPNTEPMDEVADFKGPNGNNTGNAEIPEIGAIKNSIENTKAAAVSCKVCGKPVTLDPSAKARAKEFGGSPADYTRLFDTHAQCQIDERNRGTSDLIKREYPKEAADDGTELRYRPDYGEKGSYTQEMNVENEKTAKTIRNTNPIITDSVNPAEDSGHGLCETCGKPHTHKHNGFPSDFCQKCCSDCKNKKKADVADNEANEKGGEGVKVTACAPFETPFTNVGPGTSAHENAEKAIAVKVDTVSRKGDAKDAPIGIAIDETGVPRRPEEERKVANKLKPGQEMDGDKKKTRCKSCGALLVNGKCPVNAKDCGRGKKASSESAEVAKQALQLLDKFFEAQGGGDYSLITKAIEVLEKTGEFPEATKELYTGLGESDSEWAFDCFDSARGILMTALQPKEFDIPMANHVSRAIAKNLTHEFDASSTKTKAARTKREGELNKYASRRKMADVPLTIDSIWDDITEDFGEAPQIELPGEGSSHSDVSPSSEPKAPSAEAETKTTEEPKKEEKKPEFKSKMFNKDKSEKKEEPTKPTAEEKPTESKAEEPKEEKKETSKEAAIDQYPGEHGCRTYVGETDTQGRPKEPIGHVCMKPETVKIDGRMYCDEHRPDKQASTKIATWMNRYEIEEARDRFADDPILGPVTTFLYEFMEEVNDVSDGWHSWPLPARAASQLMDLIEGAWPSYHGAHDVSPVTIQQVAKAMAPIKAFMTRRGLKAGMTMPSLIISGKKVAANKKKAYPDWKAPSGLIGWKARLQDNYDGDFEQFESYDDIYGIAERLGFASAQEAWDANPMIGGSVEPSDLKVIHASGKKADDVSADITEAKSEVVSPDTIDMDIKQPTKSVEEAAKVGSLKKADAVQSDIAEAKSETVSPDTVDADIKQPTVSVSEAAKVGAVSFSFRTATDINGDISEAKSELDGSKAGLADSSEATKTVNPEHFAMKKKAWTEDQWNKWNAVSPDTLQLAQELIDSEDEIALDVAAEFGRDFQDVKLMPEFIKAVAEEIAGEETLVKEHFNEGHHYLGEPLTAAAGDELDESVEMSIGFGDLADLAVNLPEQDTAIITAANRRDWVPDQPLDPEDMPNYGSTDDYPRCEECGFDSIERFNVVMPSGPDKGSVKRVCEECKQKLTGDDEIYLDDNTLNDKTASVSKTAEAMYTDRNFKTKKDLAAAVAAGRQIRVYDPGFGMGGETPPPENGTCAVAGPHYPEPHRWYATVTLKNGVIVKVSSSPKTAEWKGWTPEMPVQVVGVTNHQVTPNGHGYETYPNLAAAQAVYPDLDPSVNGKRFSWAMYGKVDGQPAIRFETWPANDMYSA
jgi:hypothetical protein